jgi:hypothetical protein
VFLISWFIPSISVQAATVNFSAVMDCNQANAGIGTCAAGGSGTGSGSMMLDTDTGEFSWDVMWSGLSSPVTVGHFHGPALPNVNAGVQVPIDVTLNPTAGSAFITASQAADLLSGLWYINIHSEAFRAGEIRGQVNVIPVPAAFWLFGTALVGFIGFSRRRKVA